MNEWVVLDTESTGVEPGSRLIELAGIRFNESGDVLDRFETLVNPGMPLPADVQKVHHIDPAMLTDAPTAGIAIVDFMTWAGVTEFLTSKPKWTFVAHFARFDCGLLAWEAQRYGITIAYDAPVIDTWAMAKADGSTTDNKLPTLVKHYGIDVPGDTHRAMADAEACMRVFLELRKRTEPKSVEWELSGYDYGYPSELPEPLAALPDWVAAGAPIQMRYADGKGAETDRVIVPYGFAQKADALHFHGMCQLRGERRTFRADRVSTINELPRG